jgi:hypothetical protein
MKIDATKSKARSLFVSLDLMPCFISHVHIKMLDCEFSSEALLDIRVFACFWIKTLQ